MFQALNQILSTGWFSLQLRRALGGPSEVGGSGRDRKLSAQPRVAREREEPGRETSPGFLPRHCLSR